VKALGSFATSKGISEDTPDVIVFQELMYNGVYKALQTGLKHIFPYYTNIIGADCTFQKTWTSLSGKCNWAKGGVAIFSRHEIVEAHGLIFDAKDTNTWDKFAGKGAVLAKIMIRTPIKNAKITKEDYECDKTWKAGNHKWYKIRNCEKYSSKRWCKDGGYGPNWKPKWGLFEKYADAKGRTARVCPQCGCGTAKQFQRQGIWVIGTHLQADQGSGKGGEVREKQATEFTEWIDEGGKKSLFEIDAKKEPVIVAGDLNVRFEKNHQDYEKMLELTKIRVNYTLEDAAKSVGSLSAVDNWLAKAGFYHSKLPLDYDDVLDYVGCRRDFRQPISAPAQKVLPVKAQQAWYWYYIKKVQNKLPNEGRVGKKGYYNDISDHYPVVADFFF